MHDLLQKYRPTKFSAVIGQTSVVKSLSSVVQGRKHRSFLFTGPSGTGKTTLARIVAKELGCDPKDVLEVDAATNTGIDDVRAIQDKMSFRGLHGKGFRACIMDECHALSKAAWQSLLKSIEEPSTFSAWILCTTEADKVPETIRTRCARYDLSPVAAEVIYEFLVTIRDAEKLKAPDEVLKVLADKSQGSPRRAITSLIACADVTTAKEALTLLREVSESGEEAVALCRALYRGSFMDCLAVVRKLTGVNPESIRCIVCNYWGKVALGAKSEDDAARAISILSAFSTPYPQQSGIAPLLVSLGRAKLQD